MHAEILIPDIDFCNFTAIGVQTGILHMSRCVSSIWWITYNYKIFIHSSQAKYYAIKQTKKTTHAKQRSTCIIT